MAGEKPSHLQTHNSHKPELPPPKRTFPYPPVPRLGNTVNFLLHRHRNTNTSVCKRILRSQVWKGTKVLIFFFFFQSQFSQGKLNLHELLKTSWAQDHLGTEKKTEARIPNQCVSCRACALTSPPYRCLLASLSAISVLPESTDIPLTWNIIFPSPYLQ